ncbi:hypothetical protein BDR05DRAFT_943938 [Suillus weaverae]|nr:hypothetical protein BDR05DRAFT_943938 [Suillus weaverae]
MSSFGQLESPVITQYCAKIRSGSKLKLTRYVTTADHEINNPFPDLARAYADAVLFTACLFNAKYLFGWRKIRGKSVYYRKNAAGISMNGGNCIRGNRMHTRAKDERGIKVGVMMECGTTNEEQQNERAHANAADRFVSFLEEAGKVRRVKESGIVRANANTKQPE